MTRVTIDTATSAKLAGVRDVVELCDESGKVVGHFHPGPPRDADGKIIVPFTDEEIDALSKQDGGRPLSDIFNDLSEI